MILKSKRFVLRHLKMSDLEDFYRIQQDKDVRRGFTHIIKIKKDAKKLLKEKISQMNKKRPECEAFAIEINGKFSGFIEIHHLNIKNEEHKGGIGFCIDKKYRGKDIATDAVKIITKYAFKKYKLNRIQGNCKTFNKASAKVLQKNGYKLEGILKKNLRKNGKCIDEMVWAIVR